MKNGEGLDDSTTREITEPGEQAAFDMERVQYISVSRCLSLYIGFFSMYAS